MFIYSPYRASIFLQTDLGTDFGNVFHWINIQSVNLILYPSFAAAMLAMMVFVTSPLNDLGDIKGDKEAGRRTIPIVLGKEHTDFFTYYHRHDFRIMGTFCAFIFY